MRNWKVIYYDKKDNEISSHVINNRTEYEAKNEAMADMPTKSENWSLTEYFTEEEINEFKEKWGQTHSDLCSELGYSKKNSEDIIMIDFFWIDADKKWYNNESSCFTEREQEIADYLRNL